MNSVINLYEHGFFAMGIIKDYIYSKIPNKYTRGSLFQLLSYYGKKL